MYVKVSGQNIENTIRYNAVQFNTTINSKMTRELDLELKPLVDLWIIWSRENELENNFIID